MKRRNIFIIAAIILFIIMMIAKCNCNSKTVTAKRFVNPPIPAADVPFSDYTVDASKGDTIMYPSGSVLLFPPDAFVDKNGKLIKGKVNIKYREFSNPVDYFLSGIPMGYDSAGVHYTFESAGMCDIQAFKDGQPVFVNKTNKPEINIASANKDLAQNLYVLDTVTKQWVNRGKSEILEVGKKKMTVTNPRLSEIKIPTPVKPFRIADDLPIIKVTIDPESFQELMVYNNLQFQLDKDEKRFNPEDSYIRWDDIKLKKGNMSGIYTILFTKTIADKIKSVEYKVRPVLNDNDYANAMLVYDKQMKDYENKIEARLISDKANRNAYIKDSINNTQIDKDNQKTAQLNKIIEAKNAEIEKINAEVAVKNKIIDAKNAEMEKIKSEKIKALAAALAAQKKNTENDNLSNRVLRNFEIDGFGIWNCDKPMPPETFITLQPVFQNTKGDAIDLYSANLFVRDLKGLYQITDNKVEIPRNHENMIVGVSDGRFAYITYDEFKNLQISPDTKIQTFPMHIVSNANNNYEFIKSVASF